MERYAITVTFKPHLKYDTRIKAVPQIAKIIRDSLKLYFSYKFMYAIEYHKYPVNHPFAGQPNPMAPHVHGYLEVEGQLTQKVVNQFYRDFSQRFGRTQFDQLHTIEDAERWVNYCAKDVQANNSSYPSIRHYKEVSHDVHIYTQKLDCASNIQPYFSDTASE